MTVAKLMEALQGMPPHYDIVVCNGEWSDEGELEKVVLGGESEDSELDAAVYLFPEREPC